MLTSQLMGSGSLLISRRGVKILLSNACSISCLILVKTVKLAGNIRGFLESRLKVRGQDL